MMLVDGIEQHVKKQRCIRTIHAEQNLLLFTDRADREGSTVYVTDQPCWTCANMLANSGITEIVYHRSYPKDSDKVMLLMEQKGITFRCLGSLRASRWRACGRYFIINQHLIEEEPLIASQDANQRFFFLYEEV